MYCIAISTIVYRYHVRTERKRHVAKEDRRVGQGLILLQNYDPKPQRNKKMNQTVAPQYGEAQSPDLNLMESVFR